MDCIEKRLDGIVNDIIAIEKNPEVTRLLAELFDTMLSYISEKTLGNAA